MMRLSVAEAARKLGVGVPRIHQRIADGSLRAERIGSQWVIDEQSLLHVMERKRAGRPPSARSAWAIIAESEDDAEALASLAPIERSRARARLRKLLELACAPPLSESDVLHISVVLRDVFRNRARRERYRAAPDDLPALKADARWKSLMNLSANRIASSDVDGYIAEEDLSSLTRDFLLVPAGDAANVVIHLLPEGHRAYQGSKLQLAADLAEIRGPREELRAAELLFEVALQRGEAPL